MRGIRFQRGAWGGRGRHGIRATHHMLCDNSTNVPDPAGETQINTTSTTKRFPQSLVFHVVRTRCSSPGTQYTYSTALILHPRVEEDAEASASDRWYHCGGMVQRLPFVQDAALKLSSGHRQKNAARTAHYLLLAALLRQSCEQSPCSTAGSFKRPPPYLEDRGSWSAVFALSPLLDPWITMATYEKEQTAFASCCRGDGCFCPWLPLRFVHGECLLIKRSE